MRRLSLALLIALAPPLAAQGDPGLRHIILVKVASSMGLKDGVAADTSSYRVQVELGLQKAGIRVADIPVDGTTSVLVAIDGVARRAPGSPAGIVWVVDLEVWRNLRSAAAPRDAFVTRAWHSGLATGVVATESALNDAIRANLTSDVEQLANEMLKANGSESQPIDSMSLLAPIGAAIRKAHESRARADWEAALKLAQTVDAIAPSAMSKYYIGIASFQVAVSIMDDLQVRAKSAETKKEDRPAVCTLAKQAEDMLAITSVTMPLSVDKDTAGQIMGAVQTHQDYIGRLKKAFCQ